jgi:hypothetical protein
MVRIKRSAEKEMDRLPARTAKSQMSAAGRASPAIVMRRYTTEIEKQTLVD